MEPDEVQRRLDSGSFRPTSVIPALLRRRRGLFPQPVAVPAEWIQRLETKGLFTFGYFNPDDVRVCLAAIHVCPSNPKNSLLALRFWGPHRDIPIVFGRWSNQELQNDVLIEELLTGLFTREQLCPFFSLPRFLPTWVFGGDNFSPGWGLAHRVFMEQARQSRWDPRPALRSMTKFQGRPWERWLAQQNQEAWLESSNTDPSRVSTKKWRSAWIQEWWEFVRKPEHREAEVHATWVAWQRQVDLANPLQMAPEDQLVDPRFAAESLHAMGLSPF